MLTCNDFASMDGRKRISPSAPEPAAAGGTEHPPAALTQVLRISRSPPAVSATARTEVKRSTRTRMSIAVIGTAPVVNSNVAASGEGLLSMNTRTRLMARVGSFAKCRVTGVAAASGVFAGASRLMNCSSTTPMA